MSPQTVVLTGPNGAGKTNLLEAVSLLAPGRGLRRAKVVELERSGGGEAKSLLMPWAVNAALRMADGGESMVATGRDPEAAIAGTDRRIVRVDGTTVSQNTLAELLGVVWLTPQLDQLFQEGQSARRKFFDRLVYGFEADHASHVSAYEQAMRERNLLLQERRGDAAWFAALEQRMAEHAVVVAVYRLQTKERLNAVIAGSQRDFPKAVLEINGVVELLLAQGLPSLEVEERFRALLKGNRAEDGYSGRTREGIHASEWRVTHQQKQVEAGQCSTGEQKAVLLSIVLAQARAQAKWGRGVPILLLDEVVAHLDRKRRAELADEILDMGGQAWLTGTDAETFGEFTGKAQFFYIQDATARLQNRGVDSMLQTTIS